MMLTRKQHAKKAWHKTAKAKPRRKPRQLVSIKAETENLQPSLSTQTIFWIVGIIAVVLVIVLLARNTNGTYILAPTVTIVETRVPNSTFTAFPLSETPRPSLTPTVIPTSTNTLFSTAASCVYIRHWFNLDFTC